MAEETADVNVNMPPPTPGEMQAEKTEDVNFQTPTPEETQMQIEENAAEVDQARIDEAQNQQTLNQTQSQHMQQVRNALNSQGKNSKIDWTGTVSSKDNISSHVDSF